MTDLNTLLDRLSRLHARVCPRQVLGLRIGLHGCELLGLEAPREDKRLLVFSETDGCFADGVSVATGCWVGRRTLRVVDFGKTAAVFVDTETQHALRIWPHPEARERAARAAPQAASRWHAFLEGYAALPASALLLAEPVLLTTPVDAIVGQPGIRVECARCGEEIMNGREVRVGGKTVCAGCAGGAYYIGTAPAQSGARSRDSSTT
jgi:formylmethanofuran dehydrogenase subunit E